MIISKPKIGTLFSITFFLIIAFGLFTFGLIRVDQTNDRMIWMVLMYTTGPIGVVVLIKTLLGYRIFKIGKEKFEIKYPFKFARIRFEGKEIKGWKHSTLKTFGGLYEEITWQLESGKQVSLSKQEHTEYQKTLSYMKKKFKKIEIK